MNKNKLTIITDDKNCMEGNAINQAQDVCKLDGVEAVFAMPDLHAGKTPVLDEKDTLFFNHNNLERGNPVRIYEGIGFRRADKDKENK